jgi:hypothetical protein
MSIDTIIQKRRDFGVPDFNVHGIATRLKVEFTPYIGSTPLILVKFTDDNPRSDRHIFTR